MVSSTVDAVMLWLNGKVDEINRKQAAALLAEKDDANQGSIMETTYGFAGEVNMSKVLAKAAHNLSLSQKRLIMYAVSKIHPTHPQPAQLVVKVSACDYAEEMNVHTKNAYKELHNSADNLFDRYISLTKGNTTQKIHWVSSATYHRGEGWVELRFTPEVSPFLSMLTNGNHITYKLQTAIDLRSIYSWRLLELLMQWSDTKRLYITLEDFRHALEVPEKYLYSDIRAHCIEKSIKELDEKLNIEIEWEPVKKGRAVNSLRFSWKETEQLSIDLQGGETKKTKRPKR